MMIELRRINTQKLNGSINGRYPTYQSFEPVIPEVPEPEAPRLTNAPSRERGKLQKNVSFETNHWQNVHSRRSSVASIIHKSKGTILRMVHIEQVTIILLY